MKTFLNSILVGLFFIAPAAFTATADVKGLTIVKWHGHAAFEITTPKGHILMIDPWLSNPANPENKSGNAVIGIKKLDYILITHGHSDHVGDSVALAKQTKARLVTTFELGANMGALLGFPQDQMGMDTLINAGGEIQIADGEVTVAFTPAVHSSGITVPGEKESHYGGSPVGIILKIKNGPTIYHTGDTAYFSDMKLIGEQYSPDLALINIGGHFGMEAAQAARAAEAVRAKTVIPQHFKTFPLLTQSAEPFAKLLKAKGISTKILEPGESVTFEGHNIKKN